MRKVLFILLLVLWQFTTLHAQVMNSMDVDGNLTQRGNGNFNPHNNDTTRTTRNVPKGIHAWTIDQRFGDVRKVDVDTLPHLYPQSMLATGSEGQYQTVGSNFTPRLNRIFTDRSEGTQHFFLDSYSQLLKQPWQWHFTNTFSPITNLSYLSCGDKTDGEDVIDARFAVNAGKLTGIGFDLDYRYARGYFQNQNNSHFGATFYVSHLGDRYQLHAIFQTHHQKAAENGGITNDDYITHPELFTESYSDNEIPTQLSLNWNRHHHQRLFLSHRYAIGFYRQVPMTEQEIAAKKAAQQSDPSGSELPAQAPASGRPDDAVIAGDAPADSLTSDSLALAASQQGRMTVSSKEQADSIMAANPNTAQPDSASLYLKQEFVPVTSFIHTIDAANYQRTYRSYFSPSGYYANQYYNANPDGVYKGDSINDLTHFRSLRNTLAIALLEGFNKYAAAGLKAFVTHELRQFRMPGMDNDTTAGMHQWTEHNISIGAQIVRTQGSLLHYNFQAETWLAGEDAKQLKLDAQADLNLRMLGDTVRLDGRAYMHSLNPLFIQRHYHSKHLWWDNEFDKETHTHLEASLIFPHTHTRFRVAADNLKNYTYLTLTNTLGEETITGLTADFRQSPDDINILTAQLDQQLSLGPIHWDNVLTFQHTSDEERLPLPRFNVFTNLYLKFMVAHVLSVELGASATWFSRYNAPQYLPMLGQYGVQQNQAQRVEVGNFPFVDVYANLHLKHARFFVMLNNAMAKNFTRQAFLTPHYPMNRSVLYMGVSWNFFN